MLIFQSLESKMEKIKLTVIIPTLNRPTDLLNVVHSLIIQSRLPDELIIIDQSIFPNNKLIISNIINSFKEKDFNYIHNSNIKGLVAAKKFGVENSTGNVICFLEDDVIIDFDYLSNIIIGFISNENMLGCSGIIINHPVRSLISQFIFNIFHVGIFKDYRSKYFDKDYHFINEFIPCNTLSGGVSAWRREVFDNIQFDEFNGFHLLEDIDYSTRASYYYGDRFFINTSAHLSHFPSPLNRFNVKTKYQKKTLEFFLFYKKRRSFKFSLISFSWLLIGLMFDSLLYSLKSFSTDSIIGYIYGLRDGLRAKVKS